MQVNQLTCNIGAELKGVQIKDAIASEDYEKAKENRDLIRSIEERWLGSASMPPAPRDTTP